MNKSYTMDEYICLINEYILNILPVSNYNESVVCEAMRYSVENGGKRIRPVLTLEFCRLCGGDVKDALPLACAIEMVHTYSLIHDDLPCMDNDDMRRGKPSCHIKYGEDFALLAGDGLLTYAFETICSSKFAERKPAAALEAIKVLSSFAGVLGMIGGQVIDLKSEGKCVGLDVLSKMDELKTGALIKASCLLGVIAGEGDLDKYKAAETFAEKIGHAFQIVDDILDVTADEKLLGKPVGSDKESNKSTYASLLGVEESQKMADKLTAEAIASLDTFDNDTTFLKELAIKLASRKN